MNIRAAASIRAILLLVISLLSLPLPARAALNAYAALQANGNEITGQTSVLTIGGVDVSDGHIECVAANHEIFRASAQTSALTHTSFKIVKRVDKASPLLYQALSQNQTVTGEIKYFRNNPDDGSTEHYFSIVLNQARITGIRHWAPNNLDPAASNYPQMEEVSISYQSIVFRDNIASTEHEITVSDR